MLRKIASTLLALTGLLIGLGAFGHSFMGRRALDAGLASLPIDVHTDKLIYLVWYFCGGCMLVFGALVIWSAWKAMRGEKGALFASGLVGAFYLLVGVLSLIDMREPFWSVFVVLGTLALVLSGLLGFAPAGRHAASRADQPLA
ncbi:MAG: hypothetical protein J0H27_11185 [Xanthomonadales bacterium]|nr:hypothetical protein [Xanthomonadales bacterium]ODU93504.1 MAG: hypothetical protein ABT18_07285 [Rhodanobacter sp. SCN 66-43]OJY86600.1 MAG: hypothetical protein BGP23_03145 [Xanthomonadales bacterium 66-474]